MRRHSLLYEFHDPMRDHPSLSASGSNVLDKFINIPPTITIREGHRIKIYLTQDMLLPAYENHDMPGVM